MLFNFTKKSFFRPFALASVLLPVLSLYQPMAYAEQAPINISAVASPSNEAKEQLMATLSELAFFSADYSQTILNEQGEVLQQGTGKFAISKPNLVNWQTITPDETLLISDGNTLWSYDPFIEQVSAYSLAKSIHNTPILLLTSDEPMLWQQYNVIKHKNVAESGSRFVITPKDDSGQIKKLTLSFSKTQTNDMQLSEFSFQDATGQISQISLSQFDAKNKPDASLFTFSLPEGVRLEDKR